MTVFLAKSVNDYLHWLMQLYRMLEPFPLHVAQENDAPSR